MSLKGGLLVHCPRVSDPRKSKVEAVFSFMSWAHKSHIATSTNSHREWGKNSHPHAKWDSVIDLHVEFQPI